MSWIWIVIVVPLAVWILSTVIRPEEKPRNLRRRLTPDEGARGDEPARAKPPGEVERFLEEINRLRRRAAEEQRSAEAPSAPPPVPEPRPIPRRVQRQTQAVPQRRPRPEESTRRASVESRPTVVIPPPVPAPPPTLPVSMAAEVIDVVAVAAMLPVAKTSQPLAREPLSPAAATLRGMFRTPQNLAAAIMLQEVLGPPRCRKRSR